MKLVVSKNNQIVQTLELDPEIDFPQIFLLGRSPHCHINVQDSNLSREHGKFILEDKQLYYQEQNQSHRIKMNHAQSITAGSIKVEFLNPEANKPVKVEAKPVEMLSIENAEPEKQVENIDFMDEHNFESEQQLNATMIEETFKLSEKEVPAENFSLSSDNHLESENEKNDPIFDLEIEPNASVDQELVDADATRVISDFVNYQLILSGPHIPFEKFNITNPVTLVGRNSKCAIIINDTEVSSQHAKFILKNNNLLVEDLKSVNGVTVNGQKINLQQLVEGDVVSICSVTFLVKVNSDFINAEKNILMPIDTLDDSDKTQEFSLGDFSQNDSQHKEPKQESVRKNKNPLKDLLDKLPLGELKNNPKRLAIYAVVFFALIMILFVDDPGEGQSQSVSVKTDETSQKGKTNSNSEGDVESDVKEANVASKSTETKNSVPEKSQEELNYLNSHYALAMSYIERGDYVSAISEIDLILKVDPTYKDVASLHGIAKDGLAKIEEQERKRIEEEERLARKKEVDELIVKIEDAMKNKNLGSADVYISQVMAIDPENLRVSSIRIEIDAIREDIRKRAEEDALKKELRKKMVATLSPGKSFYLQKEWYKATIKLNDFLSMAGMDEDLILEASTMLKEAKVNLEADIALPLQNARQYKNAQDLKNAYEQFSEVLRLDPSHEESLIAAREIKEVLMNRARIVYRQALVSESISHFSKAKEKFQEVLLIAPSDSEYYKKAEDKLKKIYLE